MLYQQTPDKKLLNFNSRVHVNHEMARPVFQANLNFFFNQLYNPLQSLVIICIGTDRSTGDSLGPLIGSRLKELNTNDSVFIYGTLDDPVHAVNLDETIERIHFQHPEAFIIAIDACLGHSDSVGYVCIKEGALKPGTGVNKNLPTIGDLQIVGIVNVGGFMEYLVLQNTRLSLVMKMAHLISDSLALEIQHLALYQNSANNLSKLNLTNITTDNWDLLEESERF